MSSTQLENAGVNPTRPWPADHPFGSPRREPSWGHGTQKPVECMRRPIVNNSRPGQAIYDPFLGSGTSLIAAEMSGRICYGLELNPAYVDVIVRRWQVFTGGLLQSGRNASVDCIPHEPASRRRSSVAVSRKLPPWWLPRRVRRRPGSVIEANLDPENSLSDVRTRRCVDGVPDRAPDWAVRSFEWASGSLTPPVGPL